MRLLSLFLLLGLVAWPATPRAARAQSCTASTGCGEGRLCLAGRCASVEAAAAPGATVYWVDRHHPYADDDNPGTRARPWATLGRAAAAGVLRPGDAVIVRAGTYRESVRPRVGGTGPARRVTFAAYPGEEVVVTGAEEVAGGWMRDGDAWRLPWSESMPAYGEREMRRELVVVDGTVLRPVYRREDVARGTFFAEGTDRSPTALIVRLPGDAPPSAHRLEAGIRHVLFAPQGEDRYAECGSPGQPGWFHVVGFTFRHAANRAQWGAVCPGSEGSLIESNTAEWTNGIGFTASGRGHVFRHNRALDNGHAGFGGSCDGCLLEYNESSRNNWKGHRLFWEAGGGKWTKTRRTTFRHHLAQDNEGPGLWLDYQNEDNVIENSVFVNNKAAGILLEYATVRTTVRNNVVVGTRWADWTGSGLLSHAASHNVIVYNTFVDNEGTGLWLRKDPERRAPDGYNLVFNNLFVRNARATARRSVEAREIAVEGRNLEEARTNRFGGNLYWPHTSSMRESTFYFSPDASHPANFRSADLARWQTLTGGDPRAMLLDPSRPLLSSNPAYPGRLAPASQALGRGVALPPGAGAVNQDAGGQRRDPDHPTPGAFAHPGH